MGPCWECGEQFSRYLDPGFICAEDLGKVTRSFTNDISKYKRCTVGPLHYLARAVNVIHRRSSPAIELLLAPPTKYTWPVGWKGKTNRRTNSGVIFTLSGSITLIISKMKS